MTYSDSDVDIATDAFEGTADNSLSVTILSDSVLLVVNGNGGMGALALEPSEIKALADSLEMARAQVLIGAVGNA